MPSHDALVEQSYELAAGRARFIVLVNGKFRKASHNLACDISAVQTFTDFGDRVAMLAAKQGFEGLYHFKDFVIR